MIPLTISQLAIQAARNWPNQPFLCSRSGEQLVIVTFKAAVDNAVGMAAYLRSCGIKPGDHVALLSENRPEWVISYLGIQLAGCIAIPMDSLLPMAEIPGLLSMSRAKRVITTSRFLPALEQSDVDLPVDLMDGAEPLWINRHGDSESWESPKIEPDDLAAVIFTSGTTGFSKGVMLTHRNLCTDVESFFLTGILHTDDNFLLLLPLHHTYSSTVNMLGALALGARATFATSYKSRDLLDDIRVAGVTILVGVPQVFENIQIGINRAIADSPLGKRLLFRTLYGLSHAGRMVGLRMGKSLFASARRKMGMESIRYMVSGGAALQTEVNQFFENLGFELLQGYGLTETSPVLSVNLPGRNQIGSVGPALHGVEFKIHEADCDGIGEICARGPMIMKGYFENPEATKQVLRDGWFHTGDAGYLDRHGNLHITGRIKNVIVTGAGKNVHPEEIEARLNISPFILESLVIGVEKRRGGGEELAAIIVPQQAYIDSISRHGHEVDIQAEVRSAIEAYNHSVPAFRRIRQWRIQEQEFDKTSTRKIKRFLYRNTYSAPESRPGNGKTPVPSIMKETPVPKQPIKK